MLHAGTILIDAGAPHPLCFHLAPEPSWAGWCEVTHDLTPRQLEAELNATGWTFFFLACQVRAISFGSDLAQTTETALRRLVRSAALEGCNCLQLDSVELRSFLRIPYLRLAAHPRHIQQGRRFQRSTASPATPHLAPGSGPA